MKRIAQIIAVFRDLFRPRTTTECDWQREEMAHQIRIAELNETGHRMSR